MITRETVNFISDSDEDFSLFLYLVNSKTNETYSTLGVEPDRVRLFKLGESLIKDSSSIAGTRTIVIGDCKPLREEKKDIDYIFDKHGVKIGWNEYGHAFIDINVLEIVNNAAYEKFYEDYKEFYGIYNTSESAKQRNDIMEAAQNLIPFGFIKTIADASEDMPIKARQIHDYACLQFYCFYLKDFLNSDMTLIETPAVEEKEQNKSNNKLDLELNETINSYNEAYSLMNDLGENLYLQRVRGCDLIVHIESLINSVANHPKEFDVELSEIILKSQTFNNACSFAEEELSAARKSAIGAAAGATGGAVLSAVTPTAAMWVATTFGTASTGTAISSLSGAAATNAAMAWLGGGTIAAGGGGIAAGQSLLALAGPIGIGVAAVSLITTITLFEIKKSKINKERKEFIEHVLQNTAILCETNAELALILTETNELTLGIKELYKECLYAYGHNYMDLDEKLQHKLASLVNVTNALSKCIGRTITVK